MIRQFCPQPKVMAVSHLITGLLFGRHQKFVFEASLSAQPQTVSLLSENHQRHHA